MANKESVSESYKWSVSTSPLAAYVTYDEYSSGLQRRSQTLGEFRKYTAPNWDGEGAEPITDAAIKQAGELVEHVPSHIPLPDAAPGADGTIGLDWENDRGTVCVDVSGHPKLHYFFELAGRLDKSEEDFAEPTVVFLDRLSRVLVTMYPARRVRLHALPGSGEDPYRSSSNTLLKDVA